MSSDYIYVTRAALKSARLQVQLDGANYFYRRQIFQLDDANQH
jgi:hypothetical protein